MGLTAGRRKARSAATLHPAVTIESMVHSKLLGLGRDRMCLLVVN